MNLRFNYTTRFAHLNLLPKEYPKGYPFDLDKVCTIYIYYTDITSIHVHLNEAIDQNRDISMNS